MLIGNFTNTGKGFQGFINFLMFKLEVSLEPNRNSKPNSPDFNIHSGTDVIGFGWEKVSESGVTYISLKIDNPLLPEPLYCSLFPESKDGQLPLVWNRPRKS